MADFDPNQRANDNAARARAVDARNDRYYERAFARMSPEAQSEAKMLKAIDAAVDARIRRMVIQQGNGINVTGGNGNWTVSLDLSALSLTGNAVVNCDTDPPTVTFTLALK